MFAEADLLSTRLSCGQGAMIVRRGNCTYSEDEISGVTTQLCLCDTPK